MIKALYIAILVFIIKSAAAQYQNAAGETNYTIQLPNSGANASAYLGGFHISAAQSFVAPFFASQLQFNGPPIFYYNSSDGILFSSQDVYHFPCYIEPDSANSSSNAAPVQCGVALESGSLTGLNLTNGALTYNDQTNVFYLCSAQTLYGQLTALIVLYGNGTSPVGPGFDECAKVDGKIAASIAPASSTMSSTTTAASSIASSTLSTATMTASSSTSKAAVSTATATSIIVSTSAGSSPHANLFMALAVAVFIGVGLY